MRPLPPAPVFTRPDLYPLGWTDPAITRAVRSGHLIALRRGQLARSGADDRATRAIAATHACTGSVLSDRSALDVHGLPVVGRWNGKPELTVPPGRVGSLTDAHLYRATLWPQDVVSTDLVDVTSVARTLVDVARRFPTSTAVSALDAALHRRLVTFEELDDVVLRCWNWPRVARAHRAIRLSDARAESPLESISRLTIRWLRLPAPEPQVVVLDRSGYPIARLDFYWDEFGVAGEADGLMKYNEDGRAMLTAEKDRQEELENLGVCFARWGWRHVTRQPHAMRSRIESAFARGRLLDRSGFRRQWSVRST
ncbi:hypothetical protein [uncultured Jatrophihabitans sp.]|uniref:hypothetical protein n=1 Tax=uncultured Jatrophihabitans sp. TaxID=1610747 RepID=UPI0035CB1004